MASVDIEVRTHGAFSTDGQRPENKCNLAPGHALTQLGR
eukprot:COSAG06_NODE_37082_length_439_cov_1.291176_1_plen_38_part_10